MSCEPIADQAADRAIPLEKVRQAGATTTVLGTVKAARTRKLVRAIDKPARLQTLDDAFNAGRGGHGGTAEAGRWRNLAWRWFTEWLTAAGVATCWTPRPMNAHTALRELGRAVVSEFASRQEATQAVTWALGD